MLKSNLSQDEKEGILVVVREIWDTYDIDHSGTLEKVEVRRFIQDMMP